LPRTFAYNTGRFQRELRIYAGVIIALATLGFFVLRTNARLLPVVYLLFISAIMVMVLMLIGPVPHLRSKHAVTGDSVILRHGFGFKVEIPFDNIAFIKRHESYHKAGTRVDRQDDTLFVLGTGKAEVRLGLREPMAVSEGSFEKVILDVEEPQEFIDCVKERRRGRELLREYDRRTASKKKRPPVPGRDGGPDNGDAPVVRKRKVVEPAEEGREEAEPEGDGESECGEAGEPDEEPGESEQAPRDAPRARQGPPAGGRAGHGARVVRIPKGR